MEAPPSKDGASFCVPLMLDTYYEKHSSLLPLLGYSPKEKVCIIEQSLFFPHIVCSEKQTLANQNRP